MQRLNRSAHAPVGTAFFLFLGLAIIPVSLRAAGVQVTFSPRLSAAVDAWQQIAEVFGASYNPAPPSELCMFRNPDSDLSNSPERSICALTNQFACALKAESPWVGTVPDAPKARAPRSSSVLRVPARFEQSRSAANRVALFVAAEEIKASFEKNAPSIAEFGAMKLHLRASERLIRKDNESQVFWKSFEPIGEIKNLQIPQSVRVLVRMKRAAAGFSAKAAECKVFAALASVKSRQCERAILNGMPLASPDNSEF